MSAYYAAILVEGQWVHSIIQGALWSTDKATSCGEEMPKARVATVNRDSIALLSTTPLLRTHRWETPRSQSAAHHKSWNPILHHHYIAGDEINVAMGPLISWVHCHIFRGNVK